MNFNALPVMKRFVSGLIPVLGVASASFAASAQEAPVCSDLTSTNAIFQCYVAEYQVADLELNTAWGSLTVLRKAPEGGSDAQKKALVSAQTAWIRLRNLDCSSEGKAMEGGSFEKVIVQSCLVSKTRERTAYLLETYQDR